MDEKDRRIAELETALSARDALIAKLLVRIEELERRLGLNSKNSSKPPSSDGLKRPAPQNLREKSGKPSGGQAGHKGDTLKQVAQPDEVVAHVMTRCPRCAADLEKSAVLGIRRRHVFDIPAPRVQATEQNASTTGSSNKACLSMKSKHLGNVACAVVRNVAQDTIW